MNLSKHPYHWFGAILLFGLTILAHGSVNDDLQQRYKGKVLTLRQFYPGEHLHFDAAGKLAKAGTPGAWTVDGQVWVKDIFLKHGVVHIQGRRLFLFFDWESKQFRDVGSMTMTDPARTFFRANVDEWAAAHRNVEIEVKCGVTQPEMADLTQPMSTVFLAPEEEMADVVPDLWSCYFKAKNSTLEQKTKCTGGEAYRVRLDAKKIIGESNDAAVFFELETKAPAEVGQEWQDIPCPIGFRWPSLCSNVCRCWDQRSRLSLFVKCAPIERSDIIVHFRSPANSACSDNLRFRPGASAPDSLGGR